MEEEEGAAGFGEDFFKNRIRLLTFIFIALSLIFNFIFTVNFTFNLTSILSLLLSGILSFSQVLSLSHLSSLILSFQIQFSHSFLIRELKERGESSDDEKREGQKSEVVLVSISVLP